MFRSRLSTVTCKIILEVMLSEKCGMSQLTSRWQSVDCEPKRIDNS